MKSKEITNTLTTRNCNYCNAVYNARTRSLKVGHGLFCSKPCASNFREQSKSTWGKTYHPDHIPTVNDIETLMSQINIVDTGCWEWTGVLTHGYAEIRINGKRIKASRFSYKCFIGEIPTDLYVCHKCDNPKCVNPFHLFAGTHMENMQDMKDKGRSTLGRKKIYLTYDQVIDIFNDKQLTHDQLSEKYSVKNNTIREIKMKKRWLYILLNQ